MATESPLRESDYAALSDFRYLLRRFLNFSSAAAAEAGLSPRQHQALLAVKGAATAPLTIGDLAARLQVRHHSAVGLIDRLAARKLVRRLPVAEDRRRVRLALTAQGEKLIARLSSAHKAELKAAGPRLRRLLEEITGEAES